MRNIEIKAKIRNIQQLKEKAAVLSGGKSEIIKQHDSFYQIAKSGRLKLRKFEDNSGELIYYERPDVEGPKLSSFDKCPIPIADNLHTVLERALGTTSIVKKVRELFLVDQTRIHVDSVEGLGNFMELEVQLRPEQTLEDGEKIANDLMEKLGVEKSDLISGAYADLLKTN